MPSIENAIVVIHGSGFISSQHAFSVDLFLSSSSLGYHLLTLGAEILSVQNTAISVRANVSGVATLDSIYASVSVQMGTSSVAVPHTTAHVGVVNLVEVTETYVSRMCYNDHH